MIRYIFLSFILILSACKTTHQTGKAKTSGFLKDYSQLQKGGRGEIQQRYINQEANWPSYHSLKIDTIEIWAGKELEAVASEDLRKVSTYLHASLVEQLGENFVIVNKAGPGVMTLRSALTEGESSRPVGDLLSNIIPVGLALSGIKRLSNGTHLAVGKASVEFELIDSVSGVRLAAGMDQRAGRKVLRGKFDKWADVKDAFEYWSSRLNDELLKTSRQTNKTAPK